MFERLDERARKRISGDAWARIQPQLEHIHAALIAVSPTVTGTLTTIYIKYAAVETKDLPYAVLWVKKSTELVLGLNLPTDYAIASPYLTNTNIKYAGLNVFLDRKRCQEPLIDGGG